MKKNLIWIMFIFTLIILPYDNAQGKNINDNKNKQKIVNIAIGSTSAGSSYYAYTTGIANAINTNPRINARVEEVGGTADLVSQVPLRPKSFVALGLVDVAWKFYDGAPPFSRAYDSLRTMLPGAPSTLQHIVSVESKIKSLYDLPGHRYGTGPPSSSTEITTKETFALIGVKGVKYLSVPNSDTVGAMKNRQVDGIATGAPPPSAMILDIGTSVPLRMLTFTEEELKKIMQKYPYYTTSIIKKGAYNFVDKDIKVPGVMSSFFIDKTFDEQLAYEMTKAVWENLDIVRRAHAFGKKLFIGDIVNAPIPIHPGALRYYLEQHIDIPRKLYPKEYK